MTKTKIIATLGPVSSSVDQLQKLVDAGVDIFRMNFSHGEHSFYVELVQNIKNLNKKNEKKVGLLLDTKGPEIRTGDLKSPRELQKNEEIVLVPEDNTEIAEDHITVNYNGIVKDATIGEKILIDNGNINFEVLSKTENTIKCKVLDGGILTSRRHVNLPGKEVSLEAITQKDWKDIAFGVEHELDFIALSFVRDGNEVAELQKFLAEKQSTIKVIAKIESFEATKNLEKIIKTSDGIMVARGDLGAEVPFYEVPNLQKKIIDLCQKNGKPVIVATHMLESMIKNPVPTRAETTDIFNAVSQKTDAIMLSGETAAGEFPIKCVETMVQIAQESERNEVFEIKNTHAKPIDARSALCQSAVELSHIYSEISTILVFTRSGITAQMISNARPSVPIFAFTPNSQTVRQMNLLRNIASFTVTFFDTPEKTVEVAEKCFLEKFPMWKNKKYIIVSDSLAEEKFLPMVQIRTF